MYCNTLNYNHRTQKHEIKLRDSRDGRKEGEVRESYVGYTSKKKGKQERKFRMLTLIDCILYICRILIQVKQIIFH